MKTMIRSFVQENHRSWDENITEFMYAYNTAYHEALKATPAMLNYGRKPESPTSVRREEMAKLEAILEAEDIFAWKERMDKVPELQAIAAKNASAEPL